MRRERVRGAHPYSRERRRDSSVAPLDFGGEGEASLTVGEEVRRFPRTRVAELGRSGGETPDGHVTADDLSPETLLDDDPSRSPAVKLRRAPRGTQLTRSSAAADIGMGAGLDEAEWAQRSPVGKAEAERLASRSRKHAADARFMEPAAAAEALARQRSPSRKR